jgi:hypothetical protein
VESCECKFAKQPVAPGLAPILGIHDDAATSSVRLVVSNSACVSDLGSESTCVNHSLPSQDMGAKTAAHLRRAAGSHSGSYRPCHLLGYSGV